MDEIISYKMCAVKVRNAKLRNYLKVATPILCRTCVGTLKLSYYALVKFNKL